MGRCGRAGAVTQRPRDGASRPSPNESTDGDAGDAAASRASLHAQTSVKAVRRSDVSPAALGFAPSGMGNGGGAPLCYQRHQPNAPGRKWHLCGARSAVMTGPRHGQLQIRRRGTRCIGRPTASAAFHPRPAPLRYATSVPSSAVVCESAQAVGNQEKAFRKKKQNSGGLTQSGVPTRAEGECRHPVREERRARVPSLRTAQRLRVAQRRVGG